MSGERVNAGAVAAIAAFTVRIVASCLLCAPQSPEDPRVVSVPVPG